MVYDFSVLVADVCGNHSVPHFAAYHGFQGVCEPSKVGVGVAYLEHRNADRNKRSLCKSFNFYRKIAQVVQLCNALDAVQPLAEGVVEKMFIFAYNVFLRAGEEELVEVFDEIFFDE